MKRPNLMKIAGASLLAFGLAALAAPMPAAAQDSSAQSREAAPAQDNQDRRGDTDWGWLGLLGLAGLAGLRRRQEHHHEEPVRQRSTAV